MYETHLPGRAHGVPPGSRAIAYVNSSISPLMWTSGEWASGGDALPMEQELLFGEASPKILLLLHARVKGSDLFGCSGKPTRTSVHVSTRWLRIWSKATVVSLMSR